MKNQNKGIRSATHDQLLTIGKECLNNAQNLYDSALLLSSNNKFGVATSLSILGMEECVKALCLLVDSQNRQYRKTSSFFQKVFKDHTTKHKVAFHVLSFLPKLLSAQELIWNLNESKDEDVFLSELEKVIEPSAQERNLELYFDHADDFKNKGLYVDYYDGKTLYPKDTPQEKFLGYNSICMSLIDFNKKYLNAINDKNTLELTKYMDAIFIPLDKYLKDLNKNRDDTNKRLKEIDERYSSYKVKKK